MADIKKRNHYVTRKFLEGFCDNKGRIWTYPKDNPTNPFPNKPSETAVYNKLYHLSDKENINAVEDYFSDAVETPASNALENLLKRTFPDTAEKENLALFFGMLMVRTPLYLNHLNEQQSNQLKAMAIANASNKENFHSSFKKVHPNSDEKEIEETRQSILNNELFYELNRNLLLKIMLDLGSIIASHLLNMKWAMIETNEDLPFIASDNFMHIYHPTISDGFYKIGLGIRDVCVHIPISKKLSLMLVNNDNFAEGLIFDVNNPPQIHNKPIELKTLIDSFNKATFIKCQNYVFASSDSEYLKNSFNSILVEAKQINDNKS